MFEGVIETLKNVHGEAVVYKGDGSLTIPFIAIFDETYVGVSQETGLRVSDNTPSLLFAVNDLPELPPHHSKFEIRETVYLVSRVEPDGKCAARAFLIEEDP